MPVSRKPRVPRFVIVLVVLTVAAAAIWFWKGRSAGGDEQKFRTAAVEQGDIRVAISATGTLSALSTVDVGSEVSGKVEEVLVDFNDEVTKGQIIARIDPSTFETQIEQGVLRPDSNGKLGYHEKLSELAEGAAKRVLSAELRLSIRQVALHREDGQDTTRSQDSL